MAAIAFSLLLVLRPSPSVAQEKPEGEPAKYRAFIATGDFRSLLGEKAAADPEDLKVMSVTLLSGNRAYTGEAVSVTKDKAIVISREAEKDKPDWLVLEKDGKVVGPYEVTLPTGKRRFVFFETQMSNVCNEDTTSQPNCDGTPLGGLDVTLIPGLGVTEAKVVALQRDMVVVEAITPTEAEIEAVVVKNKKTTKSVRARVLPGVRPLRTETNVSFTIVDPETVRQNFGKRIADRYVVVDLQIRNPRQQKVQVKKSAVWFEVDYVTAKNQDNGNLYDREPEKDPTKSRVFQYGLHHEFEHHPHSFLSVLGVFDSVSGFKDNLFAGLKTLSAAATAFGGTLITGDDFPRVMGVVTAHLLPGADLIWRNPEVENKKRTHLLTQSFQEIVQVAAQSSETAKVFLAQRVIHKAFPEIIVVSQIRDVHIELEVISEVLEEKIAKGVVEIGMTRSQVEGALGLPDRIEPSDGGSRWSYQRGTMESVVFNAEGKVTDREPRPFVEQLELLEGEDVGTGEVKSMLGLSYDPPVERVLRLVDGGELWVKPGTLHVNIRFDKNRKLIDVGYQTAFERISEQVKEEATRDEVEAALKRLALSEEVGRAIEKAIENQTKAQEVSYPSPDVQGELLTIKYGEGGKTAKAKEARNQ